MKDAEVVESLKASLELVPVVTNRAVVVAVAVLVRAAAAVCEKL